MVSYVIRAASLDQLIERVNEEHQRSGYVAFMFSPSDTGNGMWAAVVERHERPNRLPPEEPAQDVGD